MTNSEYRPTHTFREGAFNAAQVRLYGIHNSEKGNSVSVGPFSVNVDVNIKEKKSGEPSEKLRIDSIKITGMYTNPAVLMAFSLVPDLKNPADEENEKSGDTKARRFIRSIGVIYGYAYEGHCYELPKPAIMLLPVLPSDIPDDDCGYDKKKDESYKVWVVDKLAQCQVIEFSSGFVEQLVLEANLPGRRSPSTYRATMQLAHRSGRLTD